MATAETAMYKVILIKHAEGQPLVASVRTAMEKAGGYFDLDLRGVVFLDGAVPATIAEFMRAHGLKAQRVQVLYDPEWFAAPSPEPIWEKLPGDWDGLPITIDDLPPLRWLWVRCPALNSGTPFDIMWLGDGMWSTKDRKYKPEEILAQQWTLLATSGEVVEMTQKRVDDANAKRMDRATKDALSNDFEGSALQVALVTGRITTST